METITNRVVDVVAMSPFPTPEGDELEIEVRVGTIRARSSTERAPELAMDEMIVSASPTRQFSPGIVEADFGKLRDLLLRVSAKEEGCDVADAVQEFPPALQVLLTSKYTDAKSVAMPIVRAHSMTRTACRGVREEKFFDAYTGEAVPEPPNSAGEAAKMKKNKIFTLDLSRGAKALGGYGDIRVSAVREVIQVVATGKGGGKGSSAGRGGAAADLGPLACAVGGPSPSVAVAAGAFGPVAGTAGGGKNKGKGKGGPGMVRTVRRQTFHLAYWQVDLSETEQKTGAGPAVVAFEVELELRLQDVLAASVGEDKKVQRARIVPIVGDFLKFAERLAEFTSRRQSS